MVLPPLGCQHKVLSASQLWLFSRVTFSPVGKARPTFFYSFNNLLIKGSSHKSTVEVAVLVLAFLDHLRLGILLGELIFAFLQELAHRLGAHLVGGNEPGVLPQTLAAESAVEHLDWMQDHSRADLDQQQLVNVALLGEHGLVLVDDLVGAEVNGAVDVVEGDHVVDKWLRLGVVLWRVETIHKQFFGQAQVGHRVELVVEGEEGTAVLQAVALQLEFSCGVDVFNLKLEGRACGTLGDPQKEVGVLVRLEVQEVVAAALKAKIVDDCLGVLDRQLGLTLSVSHQVADVVHQVDVGVGHAARGEHHRALAVLPVLRVGFGIGKRYQLRDLSKVSEKDLPRGLSRGFPRYPWRNRCRKLRRPPALVAPRRWPRSD